MGKKGCILWLCSLLIICTILSNNAMISSAAKKTTIKTTKITIVIGQKKKIVISNKKKGAKYSFQSKNTSKLSVNKKGVVSAKKVGTTKVVVLETVRKTTKKLGTIKVTVKAKVASTTSTPSATITPTAKPTVKPTATPLITPTVMPTVTPTVMPTVTPTITPTATPTAIPTITPKPIQSYLADTNYEVPNGFWDNKSNVKYGEVKDIQYYSTATESTRKAKIILPEGYTTDKEYPVLYLLHGIGGNETSLYDDGVQYVIGNAIASGVAEKMIVVLPNACANATGKPPELFYSLVHYQAYDNFLYDLKDCLMPYVNENYSIAKGRENTAIAGFSMGGRVSLHIGFSMMDSIRYVGGLCPAFGILEYSNYGVHENGLFTAETFTLSEKFMNDTLVLIAAGLNDTIVKEEPLRYHNTLVANAVPHIYYGTLGGINNTGDGGHTGDVYKHGLYNFLRRIFHN